jgi:hypothetical protein
MGGGGRYNDTLTLAASKLTIMLGGGPARGTLRRAEEGRATGNERYIAGELAALRTPQGRFFWACTICQWLSSSRGERKVNSYFPADTGTGIEK